MLDLTFLTSEQVIGDIGGNQLDILKKYGRKCAITDFAILLGGYVLSYVHTYEGNSGKDRTGWWWLKSTSVENIPIVIDTRGDINWYDADNRDGRVRPTLHYSSISSIFSNKMREFSGIKEIEYGEYPQFIVDEDYSHELERAYNSGNIRTTGKSYTTDSVRYNQYDTPFRARTHTEYEYSGDKYIRFVGDSSSKGEQLSDGRIIEIGEPYWIKVEPIIWLVDEEADIALSKYIILSGIQFDDKEYTDSFENKFIKKYMDKYLSKEIECGVYKEKLIENKQVDIDSIFEDTIKKMNEINKVEEVKTKVLK